MSEYTVEVEGLRRTFGSFTAVDGVSFAVERGEIFGLLGPNGAGKTTTIRMLTTLLRPSGGTARVCGFDIVREAGEVRRRVGYVMQEIPRGLYLLTARERIEMEASLYHVPRKQVRQRCEEVLEVVGLLPHADQKFATFSGGMQKRLDIACGMLQHPEVLVLDEPTLGLDVRSRHQMWEYVKALKARGVTVLLATNYLDEADELCDRLLIIDRGTIVVEGKPAELKRGVGGDVVQAFTPDPARLEAGLRESPWAKRVVTHGDEVSIYVEDAARAIPAVMELATASAVPLQRISYNEPTLDDVFLLHTGRDLAGTQEGA